MQFVHQLTIYKCEYNAFWIASHGTHCTCLTLACAMCMDVSLWLYIKCGSVEIILFSKVSFNSNMQYMVRG